MQISSWIKGSIVEKMQKPETLLTFPSSHKIIHLPAARQTFFCLITLKENRHKGKSFKQNKPLSKIHPPGFQYIIAAQKGSVRIETAVPLIGVPTTSRILTGVSQKFRFSTLTKVSFLIFSSDKPRRG